MEDEYHVMSLCPEHVLRKKYLKKFHIVKPSMYKFVALLNAENSKELKNYLFLQNLSLKNITTNFCYKYTFFG